MAADSTFSSNGRTKSASSQSRLGASPARSSLFLRGRNSSELHRKEQSVSAASSPTLVSESTSPNGETRKPSLSIDQSISVDILQSRTSGMLNATMVDAGKTVDSDLDAFAGSDSDSDGPPDEDDLDSHMPEMAISDTD